MKASLTLLAALLLAALALLLWRACLDTSGLPPRLMSDMTARPAAPAARPAPGRVPFALAAPAAEGGATLFARHCAHCHGADGSGRSYTAAQPGMPDVSDLRSNPAPDAQKRQSLTAGRGAMPAFGGRLRPAELDALHAFILTLHPQNTP